MLHTHHAKQRICFRFGSRASARRSMGLGRADSGGCGHCPRRSHRDRGQVDGPTPCCGRARLGRQANARPTPLSDPRSRSAGPPVAGSEADRPRVPDRPLDGPTRGRTDPPPVRGVVPSALPPGLAHAAWLFAATPDAATPSAERRDHHTLGRQRLAAHSKKASDTHAHLVLIDETGLFLNPVVRRTWSLIGHTPVLDADGGPRTPNPRLMPGWAAGARGAGSTERTARPGPCR